MANKPVVGPVVGGVVDRLTENKPVAGAIVEAVRRAAERDDTTLMPQAAENDAAAVAEEFQQAVEADPVLQNQLGMEPLSRSRTFISLVFGNGAFVTALGAFIVGISSGAFDPSFWEAVSVIVPIVLGAIGNAWGTQARVRTDQAPFAWFGIPKLLGKIKNAFNRGE